MHGCISFAATLTRAKSPQYLNSGPGCIGGAYVNKRHEQRDAPHLKGWWSNKESTRFQMRDGCDTAPGIDGFRLCNPPPILVALVKASLEVRIFFRFF